MSVLECFLKFMDMWYSNCIVRTLYRAKCPLWMHPTCPRVVLSPGTSQYTKDWSAFSTYSSSCFSTVHRQRNWNSFLTAIFLSHSPLNTFFTLVQYLCLAIKSNFYSTLRWKLTCPAICRANGANCVTVPGRKNDANTIPRRPITNFAIAQLNSKPRLKLCWIVYNTGPRSNPGKFSSNGADQLHAHAGKCIRSYGIKFVKITGESQLEHMTKPRQF